jgi:hypothetical protein
MRGDGVVHLQLAGLGQLADAGLGEVFGDGADVEAGGCFVRDAEAAAGQAVGLLEERLEACAPLVKNS